jgi:minor extracellular protease Epr
VALLFAGSSTYTLANPFDAVLSSFNVTVDGPSRTPGGTTGGSALSVTVTTDQASYVNRDRATITANVTDGTSPVSGALVNISITTAKGNMLACNPTSNSSRDAVCTYKVNANRDGRGTYSITVTATKSGYSSGSGSTTFEVT